MPDIKFDPRVVCAFCETIIPLEDAATIRHHPAFGGRLIAYLCEEHAAAVKPKPETTKENDR